jgi:hypothetical protein
MALSIPKDVFFNYIFECFTLQTVRNCSLTCKLWNKIAKEYIEKNFCPANAWGPREWFTFWGCRTLNVPRLDPETTEKILQEKSCFFSHSWTVEQTHVMPVLIPRFVRRVDSSPDAAEELLTVPVLAEVVGAPKQGKISCTLKILRHGDYENVSSEEACWAILIYRVEQTSHYDHPSQIRIVHDISNGLYTIPTVLEMAVCKCAEYALGKGDYTHRTRDLPYYVNCLDTDGTYAFAFARDDKKGLPPEEVIFEIDTHNNGKCAGAIRKL